MKKIFKFCMPVLIAGWMLNVPVSYAADEEVAEADAAEADVSKESCEEGFETLEGVEFVSLNQECRQQYLRKHRKDRKAKRKALFKDNGLVSMYMPGLSGADNLGDYKEAHVYVSFSVDTNGKVVDAKIAQSKPVGVMDEQALETVSGFQFLPVDERVDGLEWSFNFFNLASDEEFKEKK